MNRFSNPLLLSFFSLLAFASASVACSGDAGDANEPGAQRGPEDVFAVAPGPVSDASEVTGIWETTETTRAGKLESRLRFELRADHVIAAARCTTTDGDEAPVVAGARVSGGATADAITVGQRVEATKPVGSLGVCGVRVAAGALPRCAEEDADERKGCFAVADGVLTLYQASGAVTFAKLAD